MAGISPLDTLFELDNGRDLALPEELKALYGRFQVPLRGEQPYIFANFVSTLDGVISLNEPGHMDAGEISAFNPHDRMVMGLLRAVSDAVIAGASTLRSPPGHIWTPEFIYPALDEQYQALRKSLGKTSPPLNVIVTGQGNLDFSLPLFQSGSIPVLVVTTTAGFERMQPNHPPASIQIMAVQDSGWLDADTILEAISRAAPASMILLEGGPRMLGKFMGEERLDELFLTLAPQVAGRDEHNRRPGLINGIRFAPDNPRWLELVGIKRGNSHLFLRYRLTNTKGA